MTTPLPKAPDAKAASLDSSNGLIVPSIGATIVSPFALTSSTT